MRNYSKEVFLFACEGNSAVECQLPKLNVAGSIPVPRSETLLIFRKSRLVILGIFLYFLSGCATVEELPSPRVSPPKAGIYHKIREGETIWRIAKTYNVTVDDIVSSNRIPNVAHIEKNQLLFIPGAKIEKDILTEKELAKSSEFNWPLKGKVLSYFGDQKGIFTNHGIDIAGELGGKVTAARSGKVVFADYLSGYGNTVILDHEDDLYSVYAHNAVLLVKLSDAVSKGDPIAEIGKVNGRSVLHFEIRKRSVPTNPLHYLP